MEYLDMESNTIVMVSHYILFYALLKSLDRIQQCYPHGDLINQFCSILYSHLSYDRSHLLEKLH